MKQMVSVEKTSHADPLEKRLSGFAAQGWKLTDAVPVTHQGGGAMYVNRAGYGQGSGGECQ